jgi:hypothetical protein
VDTERLTAVMDSLMNQTVLGELLAPVARALAQIRGTDTVSRVLSMADFIGLGVLRHLQGMRTLREQVQSLLHWEPGTALRAPLARSTWSDALSLAPPPRSLAGSDGAVARRGTGGAAGSSGAIPCPARAPGVCDGWDVSERKRTLRAVYAPAGRRGQSQGTRAVELLRRAPGLSHPTCTSIPAVATRRRCCATTINPRNP